MRAIKPGASLIQEFVYTQQALPTHKPVVQYVRQSTDTQVRQNKQGAILQDEKLARRLVTMGFSDIIKIDTDTGKSGQKRRDERKGLDYLYRLVENGNVGAVAAFSPSRLYRDLLRVESAGFVTMCQSLSIPVITFARIYWPTQQDMDALEADFREAARFIDEEIHGKLLPAKHQAIEESLSYGGGSVPLGYIVNYTDERKYYVIYEPHAQLVQWLFKRFKELGGNLSRLGHELRATGFSFPAFQGVDKKPHVSLPFVDDIGYVLRTRDALISILTNVAYIGWYLYDGVVVSKAAHDAIVDYDLFMYAYSRLSPINLDGTPNENKPVLERRFVDVPALLENVLTADGNPVYAMARPNAYVARLARDSFTTHEFSIPIPTLDTAFRGAVIDLLVTPGTACTTGATGLFTRTASGIAARKDRRGEHPG